MLPRPELRFYENSGTILSQNKAKATHLHIIEFSNTLYMIVLFIYMLVHLFTHLVALLQNIFDILIQIFRNL